MKFWWLQLEILFRFFYAMLKGSLLHWISTLLCSITYYDAYNYKTNHMVERPTNFPKLPITNKTEFRAVEEFLVREDNFVYLVSTFISVVLLSVFNMHTIFVKFRSSLVYCCISAYSVNELSQFFNIVW